VEKVIELKLDSEEQAAFDKSVAAVKSLVKTMDELMAKAA
jgi:malate/lactate dehydrogenase